MNATDSPTVPAGAPGLEGLAPEPPSERTRPAERYKVQFTATEEYVRLVEQAKALLSHANPRVTLEELQLRAMRAFVAELFKKKFAAKGSATTHARGVSVENGAEHARSADVQETDAAEVERPVPGKEPKPPSSEPREHRHDEQTREHSLRRRGRYIPAPVRRAVFERDGCRCTYVAATGERCIETHFLEFHHHRTFARGGEHDVSNLTLRCATHNALAAEEDFGRSFIGRKIHDAMTSPRE